MLEYIYRHGAVYGIQFDIICNDFFTGDTGSVLSLRYIGEKRGKQKKSAQQHPSFL